MEERAKAEIAMATFIWMLLLGCIVLTAGAIISAGNYPVDRVIVLTVISMVAWALLWKRFKKWWVSPPVR